MTDDIKINARDVLETLAALLGLLFLGSWLFYHARWLLFSDLGAQAYWLAQNTFVQGLLVIGNVLVPFAFALGCCFVWDSNPTLFTIKRRTKLPKAEVVK
jgi:hypothetical protein